MLRRVASGTVAPDTPVVSTAEENGLVSGPYIGKVHGAKYKICMSRKVLKVLYIIIDSKYTNIITSTTNKCE